MNDASMASVPLDADGQGLASALPMGHLLALPPEATLGAFPQLGLSPAAALLLSGMQAQRPAGSSADRLPPPNSAAPGLLSNATLAAALAQQQQPSLDPASTSGAPAPLPASVTAAASLPAPSAAPLERSAGGRQPGPGPGPGPGGSGGGGARGGAGAAAAAAAAAAQAATDPSDPEVVAVALADRMAAVGANIIFEKSLTASDVSGGGRVVVPKSIAEQYFPRLEQPSGVTISASDLDGRNYTFKWRFWVNNSSRMYLLEGAGELHRNYGLEVGDVMVFAQKPDGSLVVAGRVANKSDTAKKPPTKRPAAATNTTATNTNSGSAAGGAAAGPARAREARPSRAPPRPQSLPPSAEAAAAAAGGGLAGGPPAGVRGSGGGGGAATAAAAAPEPARSRKRKGGASVFPAAAGVGGGLADPRFRGGRLEEGVSLAALEMEAPSDGVFRALVLPPPTPVPLGVALARNNRWTATLDVAGELYQAFFDSREDAAEALAAAGASP